MLFLVDLEPIEKRYTKQWSHWIPEMLKECSNTLEYRIISGAPKPFKTGEFLDINRTNMYKADQVIKIAGLFDEGKIKSGDVFLFYDGWHFGITALKYMSQLQGIKTKIYAIFHAGSYDRWDFITLRGVRPWARHIERGWFEALDGIFVATRYHKNLIQRGGRADPKKVYATGLPFKFDYIKGYNISQKENIVVFPHRIAPEKDPERFDKLAKKLSTYEFIKTMEVTETKDEYYEILSRARVVFSANKQETWGIGTFEALSLGCIPVVPDRLSYREMYNEKFRYNTIREAEEMIVEFMIRHGEFKKLAADNFAFIRENYTENSVHRMMNVIYENADY